MKIRVGVEKAKGNYSTYCVDFPGCIATGKTIKEVKKNIKEAIKLHLGKKKMISSDKVIFLKSIHCNRTRLPLKILKQCYDGNSSSKHGGKLNRGSPDAGKLLMACQKYLRETGQIIDD